MRGALEIRNYNYSLILYICDLSFLNTYLIDKDNAADTGSIGPTMSIVILQRTTSSFGIAVIGILSIIKLLAFKRHFSQDLNNVNMSLLSLFLTIQKITKFVL